MLAIVMGYISIQSYFNIGLSVLLVIDLILVVVGLTFFLLSVRANLFTRLRYPFIFFLYVGITFFWFWLDGISGSTPFALIAGAVIAVLITDKKYRKILSGITLTWIVSLVIIQRKTDWVLQRIPQEELVSNNFIIFSFCTILILHFIKSKYDKERIQVIKKNDELLALNLTLNNTLKEKEEVIRQLRQTREELVAAEELASIGKLAAKLAHELNNPLNYIGGVIAPLKRTLEEIYQALGSEKSSTHASLIHEVELLLKTIEEGTGKAVTVIDNLMTLSPRLQTDFEDTFSVGGILIQNLKILKKTHPDILFESQIDPTIQITGNPMEVRQMSEQIIQNSILSLDSKENKVIRVTLKQIDKSVVINITDNGAGFSKAHVNNMFDPMVESKEVETGKKTGLFTSYLTVKKHFGEIKVESELGKGTTYAIFLPVA